MTSNRTTGPPHTWHICLPCYTDQPEHCWRKCAGCDRKCEGKR